MTFQKLNFLGVHFIFIRRESTKGMLLLPQVVSVPRERCLLSKRFLLRIKFRNKLGNFSYSTQPLQLQWQLVLLMVLQLRGAEQETILLSWIYPHNQCQLGKLEGVSSTSLPMVA